MRIRPCRSSQTRHPVFGELKTGFQRFAAALDMPLGRHPFLDVFEQGVVPGFQPNMQSV